MRQGVSLRSDGDRSLGVASVPIDVVEAFSCVDCFCRRLVQIDQPEKASRVGCLRHDSAGERVGQGPGFRRCATSE